MLDLVIESQRKDLGGGLEVGRILPFARRRMIGPFVFLDHMGPADFRSGEGIDVRPHPHIGLSTDGSGLRAAGVEQEAKSAPAAVRNREPILQVLRDCLPRSALVLEVASGTGEHAVWFSRALPALIWQPTDRDPEALRSIVAWRDISDLPNLMPPLPLDVCAPDWPVARADAVVAINMIHIAPWAATIGLLAGAARVLTQGGLLFLYGPFREAGAHTAPSNAAFDADLRARDPSWGIRDLDEIAALADEQGFKGPERIAMPANNLSVVFRRR